MWNRFSRKRSSCQQVKNQLMAYLKGEGSPTRRQAIRDHLATCDACARTVRETKALEAQLVAEAARHRPALSLQASARIQERVYKRMRRRLIMRRTTQFTGRVVGLAVVLALIVGFSALWQWGPPEKEGIISSTAPTGEAVTITFACREWQESTYRDLADQFEAANPDVRVQLVLVGPASNPSDAVTRADTLLMPVYPALTQQGLVRDLTPFIEADRAFQPEDFYPHTLESLQWDGGAWGLPFAVNFHLIFYDEEGFDAAGVPYPEPGWTWDDLLSKAQTLTEREGEEAVRWGFVRWQRDPTPFIRGRAGPLMDTSVEPPKPLLDRPEVVEAVRWFTDLVLVHRVMPYLSPEQSQPVDSDAAWLVEGSQAAMWNESTDSWELRSHGRTLGMVPFPLGGPTSATTPIELRSYAMSAGTIHPQESWRWLAFLSRQAIHREGLPARRSVAEESGYWDSLDPEVAAVYRFALEHSFSSVEAAWGWSVLNEAIEAVLQQEQTVEEALAQAQLAAYAYVEGESSEIAAPTPFAVATPQPTADAEGVTIVFVVKNWWELQEAYKALAAKFHEMHPEIEVKVKGPDWEADVQSVDLPWLAAQADCLDYYLLPLSDDTDAILNLDPLLEADPTFPLDDYYPQFLEASRHEGRLWTLPAEGYPTVMYYNKALFDAAGLAYPASDWTLDDFRALATALTERGGASRQYGYVPYSLYSDALFFVGQQGVQLAGDDTGPSVCALDAPEVVEAVRWYTELIRSGVVPELDPGEDNFRQWQALVGAEQVAMWSVCPGHGHSVFDTWKDLEVGFVPMPHGPGRVGDFDWSGYYISAQTEHPQACWEWLKFLSERVTIVQGVPARRSVAESDAYRHQMGAEVAGVYLVTLEQSQQLFTSAMYDNKRTRYLAEAVRDILSGEGVEQALSAARLNCESSLQ